MIETIAKSDIFFIISSVATILMTIVFLIIGYYVIGITKNAREISTILKKTVKRVDGDFEEMSRNISESPIFSFIFGKKKSKRKEK